MIKLSVADETLQEFRKITRLLLLLNSELVEKELSKIATTNDRKRMWVLLDSLRSPKQIADKIEVAERTVRLFIEAAVAAGLVEVQWGKPPQRKLDYVPPTWLELVTLDEPNVDAQSPKQKE